MDAMKKELALLRARETAVPQYVPVPVPFLPNQVPPQRVQFQPQDYNESYGHYHTTTCRSDFKANQPQKNKTF
jgi:hypothetical protein